MQGYFRHRIKGHIFPGVQPAGPQDEVNGLVRLTCSILYLAQHSMPGGHCLKKCNVLKHLQSASSGACMGVCKT